MKSRFISMDQENENCAVSNATLVYFRWQLCRPWPPKHASLLPHNTSASSSVGANTVSVIPDPIIAMSTHVDRAGQNDVVK